MTIIKHHDNILLMKNMKNNGQTNLFKCFVKIVDEFCEEQVIELHTSFNEVKPIFHGNFLDSFICTVPTFQFKFLINKGIAHMVKPGLPLANLCCID